MHADPCFDEPSRRRGDRMRAKWAAMLTFENPINSLSAIGLALGALCGMAGTLVTHPHILSAAKRLRRLPKAAPVCFPATLMRFSNAVALPRETFGW